MTTNATVYLIPSFLDTAATEVLPAYILEAVKKCQVFFTENERSSRRYLKSLWKEMPIDHYEWFAMDNKEEEAKIEFRKKIKEGKTIGILSDAGCPGIADPGQLMVEAAQEEGAIIKPLVGPNSMLLALMGSGMNGQHFQFVGYLPIALSQRIDRIRELENESLRKKCTQLFMETPYRNNQLLEILLRVCTPGTKLCIAANITGKEEMIRTKTIGDWKKAPPDLHKQPTIFVLRAQT